MRAWQDKGTNMDSVKVEPRIELALSAHITQTDITRSALLLSQRYGADAIHLARKRHRELARVDNSTGAQVWQRIVDELQRSEGSLH